MRSGREKSDQIAEAQVSDRERAVTWSEGSGELGTEMRGGSEAEGACMATRGSTSICSLRPLTGYVSQCCRPEVFSFSLDPRIVDVSIIVLATTPRRPPMVKASYSCIVVELSTIMKRREESLNRKGTGDGDTVIRTRDSHQEGAK